MRADVMSLLFCMIPLPPTFLRFVKAELARVQEEYEVKRKAQVHSDTCIHACNVMYVSDRFYIMISLFLIYVYSYKIY